MLNASRWHLGESLLSAKSISSAGCIGGARDTRRAEKEGHCSSHPGEFFLVAWSRAPQCLTSTTPVGTSSIVAQEMFRQHSGRYWRGSCLVAALGRSAGSPHRACPGSRVEFGQPPFAAAQHAQCANSEAATLKPLIIRELDERELQGDRLCDTRPSIRHGTPRHATPSSAVSSHGVTSRSSVLDGDGRRCRAGKPGIAVHMPVSWDGALGGDECSIVV